MLTQRACFTVVVWSLPLAQCGGGTDCPERPLE